MGEYTLSPGPRPRRWAGKQMAGAARAQGKHRRAAHVAGGTVWGKCAARPPEGSGPKERVSVWLSWLSARVNRHGIGRLGPKHHMAYGHH